MILNHPYVVNQMQLKHSHDQTGYLSYIRFITGATTPLSAVAIQAHARSSRYIASNCAKAVMLPANASNFINSY
jgi:hypothetical protein